MAKPLRHHLTSVALACTIAILTACTGPSSGGNAPTPGRVIPLERIQSSGARNAWEALQRTVPHMRFGDQPGNVGSNRGNTSVALDNRPMIFINERQVFDHGELRRLPVGDMNSIHVLNSIEGTTRYGTGAANGVIVVRTRQT